MKNALIFEKWRDSQAVNPGKWILISFILLKKKNIYYKNFFDKETRSETSTGPSLCSSTDIRARLIYLFLWVS